MRLQKAAPGQIRAALGTTPQIISPTVASGATQGAAALNRAFRDVSEAFTSVATNAGKAEKAVAGAGRQAKKSGEQYRNMGSNVGRGSQGFLNSIFVATKWVIAYGALFKLINSIQQEFGNFTKSIVDLDKAQIEFTRLLQRSSDAVGVSNKLLEVAAIQATRFSISLTEVVETQKDFLLQGREAAEVIVFTNAVLAGARIGFESAATVARGLSAIINALGVSAGFAAEAVDIINEVSKRSAISFGQLATAIRTSILPAQQAGLSFQALSGVIAAVSEATRKSGTEIGTALRSIFVFFRRPETIRAIREATAGLGEFQVNVIGADAEVKSFLQVITELVIVMDDLSDSTQKQIIQALGSTRRQSDVLAIFERFNTVITQTVRGLDATGSATTDVDRANASLAASLVRVRAEIQGQAVALRETLLPFFRGGIFLVQKFAEGVGTLAGKVILGVLLPALIIWLSVQRAMNVALVATATEAGIAGAAMRVFTANLITQRAAQEGLIAGYGSLLNPVAKFRLALLLIVAAAGAITLAVGAMTTSTRERFGELEEDAAGISTTFQTFIGQVDAAEQNIKNLQGIAGALKSIEAAADANIGKTEDLINLFAELGKSSGRDFSSAEAALAQIALAQEGITEAGEKAGESFSKQLVDVVKKLGDEQRALDNVTDALVRQKSRVEELQEAAKGGFEGFSPTQIQVFNTVVSALGTSLGLSVANTNLLAVATARETELLKEQQDIKANIEKGDENRIKLLNELIAAARIAREDVDTAIEAGGVEADIEKELKKVENAEKRREETLRVIAQLNADDVIKISEKEAAQKKFENVVRTTLVALRDQQDLSGLHVVALRAAILATAQRTVELKTQREEREAEQIILRTLTNLEQVRNIALREQAEGVERALKARARQLVLIGLQRQGLSDSALLSAQVATAEEDVVKAKERARIAEVALVALQKELLTDSKLRILSETERVKLQSRATKAAEAFRDATNDAVESNNELLRLLTAADRLRERELQRAERLLDTFELQRIAIEGQLAGLTPQEITLRRIQFLHEQSSGSLRDQALEYREILKLQAQWASDVREFADFVQSNVVTAFADVALNTKDAEQAAKDLVKTLGRRIIENALTNLFNLSPFKTFFTGLGVSFASATTGWSKMLQSENARYFTQAGQVNDTLVANIRTVIADLKVALTASQAEVQAALAGLPKGELFTDATTDWAAMLRAEHGLFFDEFREVGVEFADKVRAALEEEPGEDSPRPPLPALAAVPPPAVVPLALPQFGTAILGEEVVDALETVGSGLLKAFGAREPAVRPPDVISPDSLANLEVANAAVGDFAAKVQESAEQIAALPLLTAVTPPVPEPSEPIAVEVAAETPLPTLEAPAVVPEELRDIPRALEAIPEAIGDLQPEPLESPLPVTLVPPPEAVVVSTPESPVVVVPADQPTQALLAPTTVPRETVQQEVVSTTAFATAITAWASMLTTENAKFFLEYRRVVNEFLAGLQIVLRADTVVTPEQDPVAIEPVVVAPPSAQVLPGIAPVDTIVESPLPVSVVSLPEVAETPAENPLPVTLVSPVPLPVTLADALEFQPLVAPAVSPESPVSVGLTSPVEFPPQLVETLQALAAPSVVEGIPQTLIPQEDLNNLVAAGELTAKNLSFELNATNTSFLTEYGFLYNDFISKLDTSLDIELAIPVTERFTPIPTEPLTEALESIAESRDDRPFTPVPSTQALVAEPLETPFPQETIDSLTVALGGLPETLVPDDAFASFQQAGGAVSALLAKDLSSALSTENTKFIKNEQAVFDKAITDLRKTLESAELGAEGFPGTLAGPIDALSVEGFPETLAGPGDIPPIEEKREVTSEDIVNTALAAASILTGGSSSGAKAGALVGAAIGAFAGGGGFSVQGAQAGLALGSIAGGLFDSDPVQETTSRALLQVPTKLDLSNQELQQVNRNLVALRETLDPFALQDSFFFRERPGTGVNVQNLTVNATGNLDEAFEGLTRGGLV